MNYGDILGFAILATLFSVAAYFIGDMIGRMKQREAVREQIERARAYSYAVHQLDVWCGHSSPHARLIARHLKAHGDGEGYNAGTPNNDEACSVSGLREQLRRLDAKIAGDAK